MRQYGARRPTPRDLGSSDYGSEGLVAACGGAAGKEAWKEHPNSIRTWGGRNMTTPKDQSDVEHVPTGRRCFKSAGPTDVSKLIRTSPGRVEQDQGAVRERRQLYSAGAGSKSCGHLPIRGKVTAAQAPIADAEEEEECGPRTRRRYQGQDMPWAGQTQIQGLLRDHDDPAAFTPRGPSRDLGIWDAETFGVPSGFQPGQHVRGSPKQLHSSRSAAALGAGAAFRAASAEGPRGARPSSGTRQQLGGTHRRGGSAALSRGKGEVAASASASVLGGSKPSTPRNGALPHRAQEASSASTSVLGESRPSTPRNRAKEASSASASVLGGSRPSTPRDGGLLHRAEVASASATVLGASRLSTPRDVGLLHRVQAPPVFGSPSGSTPRRGQAATAEPWAASSDCGTSTVASVVRLEAVPPCASASVLEWQRAHIQRSSEAASDVNTWAAWSSAAGSKAARSSDTSASTTSSRAARSSGASSSGSGSSTSGSSASGSSACSSACSSAATPERHRVASRPEEQQSPALCRPRRGASSARPAGDPKVTPRGSRGAAEATPRGAGRETVAAPAAVLPLRQATPRGAAGEAAGAAAAALLAQQAVERRPSSRRPPPELQEGPATPKRSTSSAAAPGRRPASRGTPPANHHGRQASAGGCQTTSPGHVAARPEPGSRTLRPPTGKLSSRGGATAALPMRS